MKTAFVTGGSRGIGYACAERLAQEGWRIVVAARTERQVREAVARLGGDEHLGVVLDVADASAWDTIDVGHVDALVCAAGILGPIGRPAQVDPGDFVDTFAVNVLGVYNAVRSLPLPAGAPIVAFSGGGATAPFPRFDAYAVSKAALVRLMENLAADGWRANAVAPGFVVTDIQDAVLAAGRDRVGDAYFDKVQDAVRSGGGEDPAIAAGCVSWLLSDGSEGVRGKLLAARWDPWQDPAFVARLRTEPDLAALRRIDDQFFTTTPPDPAR